MRENVRVRRFGLFVVVGLLLAAILPACSAPEQNAGQIKYVFLMIGDGMGLSQRAAAEIYLWGPQEKDQPVQLKKLAMNSLPVFGAARTNAYDAIVTDSGAAGTALATGHKVSIAVISMDPNSGRRYTTLAEIAKQKGWKVGIVTSAPINDATPAAFYAHQPSRGNHYSIAMELAASGFDYFAGGCPVGVRAAVAEGNVSPIDTARKNGYAVVTNREGLAALRPGGKAWAYWVDANGDGQVYYEMDRPKDQPSLPEFTRKGIELLDNPKGFFLMVEGGEIDGACHGHDLAAAVGETVAFDQAVAEALEFYRKHPTETLIVVTNDHETGGMGLGGSGGGSLTFLRKKVSAQKGSQGAFSRKVAEFRQGNLTFEEALPAAKDFFGFEELSAYNTKLLEDAYAESMKEPNSRPRDDAYNLLYAKLDPLSAACCNLLSRQAGVAWTTYGHTTVPAPVTAIGPGSERFTGYYENTDLFFKIAAAMGGRREVSAKQRREGAANSDR